MDNPAHGGRRNSRYYRSKPKGEHEVSVAPEDEGTQTGITVFVGSSGVGKTALVAKLATQLEMAGGSRPVIGVLNPARAMGVALVRRYADLLDLDDLAERFSRMSVE